MSKVSKFGGIGGHHSNAAATVEWLTPPETIAAVGGWESIDLDPCTPIVQPYPTARNRYTILDDGLLMPWFGRVWLNPPYANGEVEKWLAKMALHNRGTALIFARTDTDAFHSFVRRFASAILFMAGRINFHVGEGFSIVKTRRTFNAGDRALGNAGAPTMLCAYGHDDADILAECGIDGLFVPLIFRRNVLVEALRDMTWAELVASAIADATEPLRVADIWALVKDHPKAKGSQHARAKVRQILQLGVGKALGRDQWVPAGAAT